MPVDWGLLSGDPEAAGFKSGNDYVKQLYAAQAQKQAGALYGSGDTQGAVAALAKAGQLPQAMQLQQGANQQNTYNQQQQDRQANIGAATALASGDTAGAAAKAASTGDLSKVEGVNSYAQSEADRKAATFEKQQAVMQSGVPFLTQAIQADPNSASQAFDLLAPHLKGAGTDDATIAQQKEQFLANPQQWLQVHGRLAKYTIQKSEDGAVLAVDENNPTAQPVVVYKGGEKPPPGYEAGPNNTLAPIKGGPADPDVKKQDALNRRQVIVNNPAPAATGTAPDADAIKNDVRIWLASKGTIQPQYAFGNAGAPSRAMFDSEKNNIMKEMSVSPEDVASGRAARVADQSSLTQLTKVQGGVEAASNTMKNSIALAKELIPKGGAQGQSPVINRWVQAGRRSILGDKDVATFNNHLDTVADEYAKIMGGGVNGSAAATDSARADAHARISKADNAQTLQSILDGLVQESEGRNRSNLAQIAAVKARLSGYGSGAASPQTQAPAASAVQQPQAPVDYKTYFGAP